MIVDERPEPVVPLRLDPLEPPEPFEPFEPLDRLEPFEPVEVLEPRLVLVEVLEPRLVLVELEELVGQAAISGDRFIRQSSVHEPFTPWHWAVQIPIDWSALI
jgi:hypothetical protein